MWQVSSKEEAIEWVKRCPNPTSGEPEIEIRQVFEPEDFGDAFTPELREQEERQRAQIAAKHQPLKEDAMRFMMLMIPKGYESADPGTMPEADRVAAMMKYNEALQQAGVLLALDGLHPPSMGARVSFEGGKPRVTDGPFAEAKEVLGGYWMIDVKSKQEAIEWASRCPASPNEVIEVRQVQEMSDFPPDVQQAAAGLPEMQRKRT